MSTLASASLGLHDLLRVIKYFDSAKILMLDGRMYFVMKDLQS